MHDPIDEIFGKFMAVKVIFNEIGMLATNTSHIHAAPENHEHLFPEYVVTKQVEPT